MGAQIAVSFDIGHTGIRGQVIGLHVFQEFVEAIVVLGPIFFIDVIGHNRQGAKTVQSRASLMACPHISPQDAVDLHTHHEIFNGLWRQGKSIDRFFCERGDSGDEIFIFFIVSQLIGGTRGINPCANPGIIHHILYLLTKHIGCGFQFS